MSSAQMTKVRERAQLQRDRILNAAQQCFIDHGFHAASMASISESAGMSPGLIYRYFENKNAIILGIIERILDEMRADIETLHAGKTDIITMLTGLFVSWQSNKPKGANPALFLEMVAHATRDPQIDQAIASADKVGDEGFATWLKQSAKSQGRHLSADEVQQHGFLLKCLIDGLLIRALREPNIDPATVTKSLRLVLPQLLPF